MRVLLNILWIIFGGLLSALGWILTGVIILIAVLVIWKKIRNKKKGKVREEGLL